jgi:hypothetical protein
VVLNLRRGRRIRCGCFAKASEVISSRTVARLLELMGLSLGVLVAIKLGLPHESLATLASAGALPLIGVALAATFILLSAVWLLHAREVVALTRATPTAGEEKEA